MRCSTLMHWFCKTTDSVIIGLKEILKLCQAKEKKVIRILGINCSPRDDSNSNIILEHSFKRLQVVYPSEVKTEVITLIKLKIQGCLACNICGKSPEDDRFIPCIQEDKDEVKMIFDKMIESDGICVSTPVHFGLPSEIFTRFIMRTRLLRHQDFKLANRPVGVMATAARRSGGAETAIIATWMPFIRNGCLVVGNGNGTSQLGAYGWAGKRGHIESDEWGLEQGFQTAERVFTIARLMKSGAESLGYVNHMRFSYVEGMRP